MIQQALTVLNRYRVDSGEIDGKGMVPVPIDFSTPYRGPIVYAPFRRIQELSPTGKHGGTKLQLLTPPIPYVRMLTRGTTDPIRRQTGRLAANGYVDPYRVRDVRDGLVSDDFRFIP